CFSVLHATISVGEAAIVALSHDLRLYFQLQFVQLRIQRRLDIVVVDLAVLDENVLDSKVKRTSGRVAARWRGRWKIRGAIFAYGEIHHRVAKDNLAQIDLLAKQRNDFDTDHEPVRLD